MTAARTLARSPGVLLALVPELPRLRLSSLDPAAIDDDLWGLIADEPPADAASASVDPGRLRPHSQADAAAAQGGQGRLPPSTAPVCSARASPSAPTSSPASRPRPTRCSAGNARTSWTRRRSPIVHVFAYSERPGTPAARMPGVPEAMRRDRAAQLRAAALPHAQAFHTPHCWAKRDHASSPNAAAAATPNSFAPVRLAQPPGEPGPCCGPRHRADAAGGARVGLVIQ